MRLRIGWGLFVNRIFSPADPAAGPQTGFFVRRTRRWVRKPFFFPSAPGTGPETGVSVRGGACPSVRSVVRPGGGPDVRICVCHVGRPVWRSVVRTDRQTDRVASVLYERMWTPLILLQDSTYKYFRSICGYMELSVEIG